MCNLRADTMVIGLHIPRPKTLELTIKNTETIGPVWTFITKTKDNIVKDGRDV